jgi:hypothetical protein
MPTKRIAGVIGVPCTRRETTPTAIKASATTARPHSIQRPYAGKGPNAAPLREITQGECAAER